MKKLLTYITILLSTGYGQFVLYPVTDFFGGGIGYSPIYINIDEFPATDLLEGQTRAQLMGAPRPRKAVARQT